MGGLETAQTKCCPNAPRSFQLSAFQYVSHDLAGRKHLADESRKPRPLAAVPVGRVVEKPCPDLAKANEGST